MQASDLADAMGLWNVNAVFAYLAMDLLVETKTACSTQLMESACAEPWEGMHINCKIG